MRSSAVANDFPTDGIALLCDTSFLIMTIPPFGDNPSYSVIRQVVKSLIQHNEDALCYVQRLIGFQWLLIVPL